MVERGYDDRADAYNLEPSQWNREGNEQHEHDAQVLPSLHLSHVILHLAALSRKRIYEMQQ